MSNNKANFRLSPEANNDLEDIWLFTFNHWGLEQANDYTDTLVRYFEELTNNPMLGQQVNQIRLGYRRCFVEGSMQAKRPFTAIVEPGGRGWH